jgi:hypothetical protein
MSTITAAEFTLNHGEVEALREAAFMGMHDSGIGMDCPVCRPPGDAEIPAQIEQVETLIGHLAQGVKVLRADEDGKVMLDGSSPVPEELAEDEGWRLVFLLERSELRLASWWGERDRAGEDAAGIELALAGARSLIARLRAELGEE